MVAPMIAAAGARLAPAIRSAGGKFMHSSQKGIRSMGSKMLRASDAKVTKKIEDIAKYSNLSLKLMGKISKGVVRLIGFLAKHSPALKQQLVVMGKAFSVMIRPIGDIMARFMRPMAVWVMKVAQKWYAMVTKRKGGGMEDPKDKEEQLVKSIEAGKAFGLDTTKQEDELSQLRKSNTNKNEGGSALGKLFGDLIPDAFLEALKAFGGALKAIWDVLSPLLKPILNTILVQFKNVALIVGGALLAALWALTFVLKGIESVFKGVKLGAETLGLYLQVLWERVLVPFGKWIGDKFGKFFSDLWDRLKEFGSWIKSVFIIGWESLKNTLSSFGSWIKDTFIGAWDALKTNFETLVDKVTGWAEKIKGAWEKAKNWVSDKFEKGKEAVSGIMGGKATGGDIRQTGLYQLHAGERVMNAGENSRGSSNNVFNTTVNLNATINNELDINMVARQLAELNETELRRRVSYF